MTQIATTRSLFRMLPGHVYTPEGPGREPESLEVPYTLQQFTLVFGGASPLAAGDYETTFVTPASGTIVVTVNSDGSKTFAAASNELAQTINATAGLDSLVYATSNGATTVTLVAKSPNTDLATPTTAVPGADTLTATETVAPAAPSLRMGLWYVYASPAYTGAITGTPRGARLAALPSGSTVVADLRGVVARTVNQTTLSPTFQDATSFDAYPAGSVAWGCLRGEVCTVVDPASSAMTIGSQVHVVIAAGTYSVIGAVGSAADGGNTIRMDNTTPVRARVTAPEETFTMGSYSGRCVLLKVNQTN